MVCLGKRGQCTHVGGVGPPPAAALLVDDGGAAARTAIVVRRPEHRLIGVFERVLRDHGANNLLTECHHVVLVLRK